MAEPTPPPIRIKPDRLLWRVLAPRWAHDPLSGEGAAIRGGRFNEPGMNALYLSADLMTAVAEYELDLGHRPGTFCAYEVDVAGIVDLTDAGILDNMGLTLEILRCPWKRMAWVDGARPPTWNVARELYDHAYAGVRVRSVPSPENGVNIVLWRWNDVPERKVVVLDPLDDLPRDQGSWHRGRSRQHGSRT